MKKIIDLPIAFNAEILAKRARKTRMVNVVSVEPFEIEDLSNDMPEIVAYVQDAETIREKDGYFFYPKYKKTFAQDLCLPSKTHILDDEKALYEQHPDWKINGFGSRRIILDEIGKPSDNPDLNYIDRLSHIFPVLSDMTLIPKYDTKTDNMIYDYEVKNYISDNKQMVINKCQNELDNHVLLNGQLFVKTNLEPVALFNAENMNYIKTAKNYVLTKDNNFLLQMSLNDADTIISSDRHMMIFNPDVFNPSDINTMAFNIIRKMQISFEKLTRNIALKQNVTVLNILNTKPVFQALLDKFNECDMLYKDNSMTLEHVESLYPYIIQVAHKTPFDIRQSHEHEVFMKPDAYYGVAVNQIRTNIARNTVAPEGP